MLSDAGADPSDPAFVASGPASVSNAASGNVVSDAASLGAPVDGVSGVASAGAAPEPPASAAPAATGDAAPSLDVVLASASPRRRQLLADAGVKFTVRVSDVDETLDADLLADPREAVKKLAERKAGAVVQEVLAEDYIGVAAVLGADTMVVLDGEIFGKPASLSHAKHMLRRLSGRAHEVLTAVSVWMVAAPEPEQVSLGFRTFVDVARVTFRELSDEEIADYLRKGESFDKAGAYAVQGAGADLVSRVEGDLDTVIGLPVGRLLREFPDLACSSR
ncbi:septum formation protein Maf [Gordonibacter sp. An230]|uniref:Maf family protein n=1 Tax=Gordonibacter sp. An230 TaxID=1965592 RepID=UPI000B3A78FE|nr:Maf family protein [Gordonibacter sp. An230]OUO89744.1 septum formation protein Maf [Gordonibacter sp. An230]